MENFMTFVYAAVLVESIVTIISNLKDTEKDWKYWVSLFAAIAISILVAYNWEIDLFSEVLGDGLIPLVGIVLTGIVVSRGANYAADLLKLLGATTQRVKNGL